ncbi:hypothetical protein [Arthrobacter sp. zg-Y179]|uniref:hypothetical protein n=1 Tax=Arthrobacter sp. zg-Y179 TaxID=2894188 RepID=UPI001E5B0461|nr:hypothetical protein [Arthrobacter sp. zg-Y179]MCC9173968.1 hypothetical protein [Arthrobacter sp. zg-Y179]
MIRNRTPPALHLPSARGLAGAALAAVIAVGAVTGCAPQDAGPGTPPDSPSGTAASPKPGSDATMNSDGPGAQLLLLHARLRNELGAEYADGWIDRGVLHVAVTGPEAEAKVRDAGAEPVLVAFSADELLQARNQVQTWLADKPVPDLKVHSISTSGRTGTVTVKVPADQVTALQTAVDGQAPAGEISVIVEESAGMTTPMSTK